MADQDQTPVIAWQQTPQGAVPVALRFGDPYYSLDGGLAETGHVFHAGNGLPRRFCPGFHIAELGFGTGLNLLATLALWQESGTAGRFRFTSFEAFPLTARQTGAALASFAPLAPLAAELVAALEGGQNRFAIGAADVALMIGDANHLLPGWQGRADAWFLDGFSPARNPELWSGELLAQVAAHTAPGGSFATYSAAGHVRRGLQAAGFQVERTPGFGRKRHMTQGWLRGPEPETAAEG